MAGGTPTPAKGTPTPTPRPGTPTPGAAKPTKRVKLPPGIMGRTPTKGKQGRGLKQLVEAFVPQSAKGASKSQQYAMAAKSLSSLVRVRRTLEKQYGLSDVQAAGYLRDLANWTKTMKSQPPGFPKPPRPKPPTGGK